jgi:hypothetical protein
MVLVQTILFCSVLYYFTNAVIVIPLTMNLPKPYENPLKPAKSNSDLLQILHSGTGIENSVYWSSFTIPGNGTAFDSQDIYASHDSFVRGAIDASTTHQHLVIQPQDVWLTILKQMSSYMRKRKDDKFVSENWNYLDGSVDDSSALHVLGMFVADGWMEFQFGRRDKTNWLRDWVRPNVGTVTSSSLLTNGTDEDMIAKALMMSTSTPTKPPEGLLSFPCENGIPSITLLGTKADWKNISDKLDPLIKFKFGKEPALYGAILRPILSRFIETFDKPNDLGVRQFWSDIITVTPKQKLCRTTNYVTGWINAFHFWDGAGGLVPTVNSASVNPSSNNPSPASNSGEQLQNDALVFDNITYPWRHCEDLPTSYSHTTMCMAYDAPGWGLGQLLVGMLAKSATKGIPEGYEQAMSRAGFKLPSSVQKSDHSILKPLPAYIHYTEGGSDPVSSFLFFTS